jgi:hypothetical protein
MAAILANGLATFVSGLPRFGRAELVCRALLVRGAAPLRGDLTLASIAHPGESATASGTAAR